MSLEHDAISEPVYSQESSFIENQPSILTNIYQPEQNIAIWQRTLPKSLVADINHMLIEGRPLALVLSVTPKNAADKIRNKLDDYACAEILSEDIALIVDMFCCLFDVKEVGLRLTSLDSPMCPKFHVDHVPCRLVTTYVGRATEWLANEGIDRRKLGGGGLGEPDHLSGLMNSESTIEKMQMGEVALLKGSGWQGNENAGLVHRSPNIGPHERRLLLTLDFI
ncbi:hypothetical protein VIN01S_11190 [Vibrio inusitatus NBRC 102082]|uniref:Succinylglutamate desuccinylase n=1 Tax=Vibrio inusitatus NBRC 102082 TaxID=1219070 RepID=A0A4Y3HTI1_9VIBR|nr:DUF1826 domain-containing protein [Vibrio inusitatus]GEA50315.1 hypothetical protein VIN01S_11190 [Vibrio inusitatus NBRC 102082]